MHQTRRQVNKHLFSEIEKLSVIMRKAEEADFRAIQTDVIISRMKLGTICSISSAQTGYSRI